MNIFRRELKASRRSLIIWSVCMVLLVVSGMGKYTAYSGGGAAADVFNDLPHSLKALLGFGSLDVTTPIGFFAMLFLYIELTTAIHAVMLGAGIIAKEENDKTTEFLLIKPISRTTVITAKLAAALVNVLVINLVSWISSVALVSAFTKEPGISSKISLFMLSMLVVQLIFLSLGAALAGALKNPKSAGSLATGLLLGAFIISKITELAENLSFLNVLSPFNYFSLNSLVAGNLSGGVALLSLALIAALSASVYFFYGQRDMKI